MTHRVIVVRRLWQSREIGGLGDGQGVERFIEIVERCRGNAIGALAEIDFIEIELKDSVLREGLLDTESEDRLFHFAFDGDLVGQQEILGDLLGDGRCALKAFALAEGGDVAQHGARHAGEIDSRMLVKILVLGGEKSIDDPARHGGDRHEDTALGGIFSEQLPIARMDPGHCRRFVIGELLVIGQAATIVIEQIKSAPTRRGHEQQE